MTDQAIYNPAEPNLKELVDEYVKNFNFVYDDIISKINNEVEDRLLCVDFSEIHAYAYYTDSMRKDYKLLKKVFTSELGVNRDCKMVLTPPAILELLSYYEATSQLANLYGDFNKILRIPEVARFNRAYENYFEAKESMSDFDIARAYRKVNDAFIGLTLYGSEHERSMGGLSFLLGISTSDTNEPSNPTFAKAHQRFIDLIQKDVIISLADAVDDPGRIKELDPDLSSINLIRNSLNKVKSREFKTTNNKIDAEMGGLCVGFNNLFKSDKIFMNFFSGSYVPNKIMLSHKSQLGVLPRCPMYALIRFYLYTKCRKDYQEMAYFSNSIKTLFSEYENVQFIINTVKEKIDNSQHDKYINLLDATYYSIKLLFYDDDFCQELLDGSRNIRFNRRFKSKLEEIIEKDKEKDLKQEGFNTEGYIDKIGLSIMDPKKAKENYDAFREVLLDNIEDLYLSLFEYVKAYDFNKLNRNMFNDYTRILGKSKK